MEAASPVKNTTFLKARTLNVVRDVGHTHPASVRRPKPKCVINDTYHHQKHQSGKPITVLRQSVFGKRIANIKVREKLHHKLSDETMSQPAPTVLHQASVTLRNSGQNLGHISLVVKRIMP